MTETAAREPAVPARRLTSLDRALRILDCFSRRAAVLGVGEVAERTGLDKSSVSRFMAKLAEHRYLCRTAGGRYSLGLRLLELGILVRGELRLEELGRPCLERLAERARCAAQITVLDGRRPVVVASAESPGRFRFSVRVGTGVPLHASAAGKVLCAFREDVRATLPIVEGRLPRITERTITVPAVLQEELERTRERGFAAARDEYFPGQISMAAPVWDIGGEVVAALAAVGGPWSGSSWEPEVRDLLLDAAGSLTALLAGGTGPSRYQPDGGASS